MPHRDPSFCLAGFHSSLSGIGKLRRYSKSFKSSSGTAAWMPSLPTSAAPSVGSSWPTRHEASCHGRLDRCTCRMSYLSLSLSLSLSLLIFLCVYLYACGNMYIYIYIIYIYMYTSIYIYMQCTAVQCSAMQCNAMQCNAMQCNAV